ncbi:MAG: hypothetical protein ABH954_02310 [Candidatus Omnitrophota bacterium]
MILFLSKENFIKKLILLASIWFIAVCTIHLFSQRLLWHDEARIEYNLKELSGKEIFGPLLEGQVFPRLYLFSIQKIAASFDYNLISLRILPFIFMIAGFIFWLKIFQQEKFPRLQHLLIVFSWAASYYLIYYAAELKQYSCDVFIAAMFTLFLYKQGQCAEERQIAPCEKLSILLPISLLFSYIGFFFVWIPLYNFIVSIKDNKKNLNLAILYTVSIILFGFLVYYFDIRFYKGADHGYWQDYFISLDSVAGFFKSLTEGINNLMSCWFSEVKIIKRIARFFAVFGLYSILYYFITSFKKVKFKIQSVNSLSLVLFAELMLLGILKIYPFTGGRITLFFAPFVLLAIINGIYLLNKINPILFKLVLGAYIVFLSLSAAYQLNHFLSLY